MGCGHTCWIESEGTHGGESNMHDMLSYADAAFDPGRATQDSGANFDPLELPLVSMATGKVNPFPLDMQQYLRGVSSRRTRPSHRAYADRGQDRYEGGGHLEAQSLAAKRQSVDTVSSSSQNSRANSSAT